MISPQQVIDFVNTGKEITKDNVEQFISEYQRDWIYVSKDSIHFNNEPESTPFRTVEDVMYILLEQKFLNIIDVSLDSVPPDGDVILKLLEYFIHLGYGIKKVNEFGLLLTK